MEQTKPQWEVSQKFCEAPENNYSLYFYGLLLLHTYNRDDKGNNDTNVLERGNKAKVMYIRKGFPPKLVCKFFSGNNIFKERNIFQFQFSHTMDIKLNSIYV